MKKSFYTFVLIISCTSLFGQSKKWFFSLNPGINIGGPSASIRHQMKVQGFDQTSSYNFFGWAGTTDYPRVVKHLSFLVRGGYSVNAHKSIYFVAGLSSKGTVSGFKGTGYADLFFISGSTGIMPEVAYNLYQLTGGYQYQSAKSRAKLGLGPSLFFYNYSIDRGPKRTSLMPGASFSGRFPFGREKRLFGIDLLLETNIAPPVKMKDNEKATETGYKPGKANLISLNAGLAFSFRK